jgi:predicted Zn-dependent protease
MIFSNAVGQSRVRHTGRHILGHNISLNHHGLTSICDYAGDIAANSLGMSGRDVAVHRKKKCG